MTPRPIKRDEVIATIGETTPKPRYKLCRVEGDKFLSVIAGRDGTKLEDADALEYAKGRVTESPAFDSADDDTEASELIYLFDHLDGAIEASKKYSLDFDKVILRVLPIGFFRPNLQPMFSVNVFFNRKPCFKYLIIIHFLWLPM